MCAEPGYGRGVVVSEPRPSEGLAESWSAVPELESETNNIFCFFRFLVCFFLPNRMLSTVESGVSHI